MRHSMHVCRMCAPDVHKYSMIKHSCLHMHTCLEHTCMHNQHPDTACSIKAALQPYAPLQVQALALALAQALVPLVHAACNSSTDRTTAATKAQNHELAASVQHELWETCRAGLPALVADDSALHKQC